MNKIINFFHKYGGMIAVVAVVGLVAEWMWIVITKLT